MFLDWETKNSVDPRVSRVPITSSPTGLDMSLDYETKKSAEIGSLKSLLRPPPQD